MINKLLILLLALLAAPASAQRQTCIDSHWRFLYGDGSAAITRPAITSTWRTLSLPHDWSVETEASQQAGGTVVGPFSTNSIGGFQTGFTVGGEGWYYKGLEIDSKALKANRFQLYFEGAYNQTEVYLNGKKLYFNPFGYISFRFDITEHLREGSNDLLVHVANEGSNTRWYAGSGIYRHVWLIQTPPVHAVEWATFLRVNDKYATTDANALLAFQTNIRNDSPSDAKARVLVELLNEKGKTVASAKSNLSVAAGTEQPVNLDLRVRKPRLWSTDDPYLYTLRVSINDRKTRTSDVLTKRVGIRTLDFSAANGFLLNGQPTLLRGGCVHHDLGLLGAASYDRAEERKLQLLKAQGFNAVRTSHGLPSECFLNVCDSLGLMVVDETFDQWLLEKNREDYHRFFAEHSTHDLETMVRRDRNHPSVVMWSIGNEIPGRIEPEGMATAERLRTTVRQLDTTRPITAAICLWDAGDVWNSANHEWAIQDAKAFESLDVGGYNYRWDTYDKDHATHPDRVICGLESYPKQASENWNLVEQRSFVIGDFVWTAMDYLGEAGIGSAAFRSEGNQPMFQVWPWFNGWCGDIDLIGQKKPQSYYRDVVWRRAPITMGVEQLPPAGTHQAISAWGWQLEEQSWTFPNLEPHTPVSVNVYSRAPRVRLYLNDKVVGEAQPSATFWTAFRVDYQPGTLRAVNLNANGQEVAGEAFELQTTSEPVGLRLTADRNVIHADGTDLSYVTIELIDAQGRVCTSDCQRQIHLFAEGEGVLLAAGNASPNDQESFRSPSPRLFRGRALAILRSNEHAGTIRLTARSQGLPEATTTITTKPRY